MWTMVAVLAALPLLLVGGLWAGQEKMIFIPARRQIGTPPGWESQTLRTEDGRSIHRYGPHVFADMHIVEIATAGTRG